MLDYSKMIYKKWQNTDRTCEEACPYTQTYAYTCTYTYIIRLCEGYTIMDCLLQICLDFKDEVHFSILEGGH